MIWVYFHNKCPLITTGKHFQVYKSERGMFYFEAINLTQVNRMSRFRRVLAIGGKQRFFGMDMVFIETILFHLESF